ncbi:RICIN domain-containing protein [Actinospica robiniae]|uniref:RICIN domain-containing protein n=1 Tax=Actinospica robiniae TaxID=304901 RepID=UPI000423BBE5|nr:RICIN domain-containing protein [Actinospica robiniae]
MTAAALGLAGCFGVALSAAPAQAASPAVSVWETTTNQSQLLAQQGGTSFSPGASSQSQVITVSPSSTYQTMTGFGASFTDSSAWLVYNSPQRNTIMSKLFDPNSGIGLDFLRQPIGASDFARSLYSYDDVASGQTDPNLTGFSISHDDSYIIPILQQALQLDPQTTIMATPWSPPGWMKSSGSMIGGSLNSADYQYFANYMVKFLQAYKAAGVPISYVTAQNEPEYSPSNYPGSTFTAAQEQSFIADNLGPAIKSAGLSTGILAYDHNWNDPSFPETILGNSSSAQYVSGVAWHCYSGDPSAQSTVEALYPSYGVYETECSGSQSSNTANTFSDTLDWEVANLVISGIRNYAKSVVTWNMALDPSGGPSMNCTTCTALVTVNNSSGSASYNAEYYALGQVSKFVKPGAVRIGSNSFGSGGVQDVAFQNPDGSTAMVVLNSDTSNSHTFGVSENGQSFSYTLPAGAVATFTWPTAPTGTSTGGGSSINTSAWYEVKNADSGLCVQPSGGGTANGTVLVQEPCTGSAAQLWQFQSNGSGAYHVANQAATSEVWDVTGGTGATANGTAIQIWSNGGSSNQTWAANQLSNGNYEFAAQNSGSECLDVTGTSTAAGAQMQQWACSSADAAQSFALVQSSGTTGGGISTSAWYEVKNAHSGMCVQPSGSGTANGTVLVQEPCTGAASQLWQFVSNGSGAYHVANQASSTEVWDVTGGTGATANGTVIQIWSSTGSSNQTWAAQAVSGGDYEFAAQNSGSECLDVTNTSTTAGAQMQQWACSSTDSAQTFALVQS